MQAASGVRCGGMQQWSVDVDKDEVMMRQMKLDGRGDCGPQISVCKLDVRVGIGSETNVNAVWEVDRLRG